MNKRRTILVLLACFLVGLVGCGKRTVQNTIFQGKEYVLEFPDFWDVHSNWMGTDLAGLSPQEDPTDEFRENVNVILENLPASMTDEEYMEISLDGLKNLFLVPASTSFTRTRVGNRDGYHVHYQAHIEQGHVDNDVYVVIDGGGAYVITCSHEVGKRDAFKSTMDGIIATFDIKE